MWFLLLDHGKYMWSTFRFCFFCGEILWTLETQYINIRCYYAAGRQEILISWTRTKIAVVLVKCSDRMWWWWCGKCRGVTLVHCLVKKLNSRGISNYSFHTNIIAVHVFPWSRMLSVFNNPFPCWPIGKAALDHIKKSVLSSFDPYYALVHHFPHSVDSLISCSKTS